MNTLIKTILSMGAIATGILGSGTLGVSDKEIQDYIQFAVVNGCRPVIDVCVSECSKDVTKGVKPECLPLKILRVDPKRATDNYLELARKNKIEIKGTDDLVSLPEKLRAEFKRKGLPVKPVLENLSAKLCATTDCKVDVPSMPKKI